MIPQVTVTTSWDDGHILDLKLAELLERYQVPGTFYIAPEDREFTPADRLTEDQIRFIAKNFEIGAHTITHPRLPSVSNDVARDEIAGSKRILEAIIGRPVVTFCYPGGEYVSAHVCMAEAAGFTYARTVERFKFSPSFDNFTAPTSLHAYRHWSDLAKIAKFAGFHPVRTINFLLNWDQLAIEMFDRLTLTGGIFHLWGHSWEIQANHDWSRLERVLYHISRRDGVRYVANGGLV